MHLARALRLPRAIGAVLAAAAVTAGGFDVARAAEPSARHFLVAEVPRIEGAGGSTGPVSSSLHEAPDGSLLFLANWPLVESAGPGARTTTDRYRLLRVAMDGSQSFVAPFGGPAAAPRHPDERFNVDEVLPLPDGSMLFDDGSTIGQLRPDGTIVHIAGNGAYVPDNAPPGDGGPATEAYLNTVEGLARMADGSILFGEGARVRRILADGTLTTVAGTGKIGSGGDGGPAVEARIRRAADVLALPDGGFLIADMFGNRVRRVAPDGTISTFAGGGRAEDRSADGGPATAARLRSPIALAASPDGSVAIVHGRYVRRVTPDGIISTIFDARIRSRRRVGDFAGRDATRVTGVAATREGGLLVVVNGGIADWANERVYYLPPRRSARTLVAMRGARTSSRRVAVQIDANRAGSVRLAVSRNGRVVASSERAVAAGRRWVGVDGRFGAKRHDVTVTLTDAAGSRAEERVELLTAGVLPLATVRREAAEYSDVGPPVRCRRMSARRVDCTLKSEREEIDASDAPCYGNVAYRLSRSGVLLYRDYGPLGCATTPPRLVRRPPWLYRWSPVG